MRSGRLKSAMAAPSRRNSGLETTSMARVRPLVAADALDLVAGADRHGGLGDHHQRPLGGARHVGGGGVDVAEVGVAVAVARGRAHRDEHRLDVGDGSREIGREGQALLAHVAGDELLQPRLEDRHHALVQRGDLLGVEVDAGDVVPEVREAGARHQPDVTRPDHGDAQAVSLLRLWREGISPRRAACRNSRWCGRARP